MTPETRRRVERVLREAAELSSPRSFADYEKMKRRLQRCDLASGEYSRAIRRLSEIMGL